MNQMLGEKRDRYRVGHLAPRLNCLPHRSSAFICTVQRAPQTARMGKVEVDAALEQQVLAVTAALICSDKRGQSYGVRVLAPSARSRLSKRTFRSVSPAFLACIRTPETS